MPTGILQARRDRENVDTTAAAMFPLTEKGKFVERARAQIRAARFRSTIACDAKTANQWREIEAIYRFLSVTWELGV